MRKLFLFVIIASAAACTNPEEKATGANSLDSIGEFKEGDTYNTSPGPASPDSAARSTFDTSHPDTGT